MIFPTDDYRRTHIVIPDKLHQGLDRTLHGLIGWYRRRSSTVRSLRKAAEKISNMAQDFRHVSDRRLRERLHELQNQFYRYPKGGDQILSVVDFAKAVEGVPLVLLISVVGEIAVVVV